VTVYVRIQGDPRPILSMLREQVRRVDSNLVVFDMRTMNEQVNLQLANERMLSFLSGGFALLATILAVVGLHGVLAQLVTQRTSEFGVRRAVGAQTRDVLWLVARQGGTIAGIPFALECFRMLDPKVSMRVDKEDGKRTMKGDTVIYISGHARGMLSSERVALNFLMRLSGVATLTSRDALEARLT